jgi:hypothetical protein
VSCSQPQNGFYHVPVSCPSHCRHRTSTPQHVACVSDVASAQCLGNLRIHLAHFEFYPALAHGTRYAHCRCNTAGCRHGRWEWVVEQHCSCADKVDCKHHEPGKCPTARWRCDHSFPRWGTARGDAWTKMVLFITLVSTQLCVMLVPMNGLLPWVVRSLCLALLIRLLHRWTNTTANVTVSIGISGLVGLLIADLLLHLVP